MIAIHLIWAQDLNGGIGKNGKLPWHIPEDLDNFKKITQGSTIIMGRKTWDSLPFKPLPKRRNIVISSKHISQSEHYQSIDLCIKQLNKDGLKKVFIIGGAKIYKEFIQKADELHITSINIETKGIDTFFPIPIDVISKRFKKNYEYSLSKHAIYSNWIKN